MMACLEAETKRPAQGLFLGTGEEWRISRTATEGWERPEFDDRAWESATDHGAFGTGEWSDQVAGWPEQTSARWIWSSENQKDDEVHFRFHFNVKGKARGEREPD